MKAIYKLLLSVSFGGLSVSACLAAVAPDPVYKALREAPITDSFVAENIVLKRDAGIVTLKSGTIAFTAPAMGRDTAAVFVGEGEFTLTPTTPIEKNYLKSLTETDAIKDTFDRAVFYFTDETGKEIRAQAKSKAADAKPADVLKDHRKRMRSEESMENIEAGILADLYRAGQEGFFTAYFHGRKHNDLRFQVKPRGGAFFNISPEEVFVLSVQPRGVRDLSLYLGHRVSEIEAKTANSMENKRIVEAESYKISTEIAKNDHFTASTEMRFRAISGGDRVIPVELVPTLRVSRVAIDGKETAFIQEDKKEDASFYVVLEQPMEKGSSHTLVIEYQGDKVVNKAGGGNFSVGARESWYPNVNSFKDHATYDLTFKVPKQYTLVSVGKLAKEWVEKDMSCSQWISEVPLAVAGFNYGSFKKKQITDKQSGIQIEGFATSEVPDYLKDVDSQGPLGNMSPTVLSEKNMSEAHAALQIFNGWFGKSEFGRMAITQQPQFNFGQSWPSLIYLPLLAYLDSTQRHSLLGMDNRTTEFVDEVTAHEVSHQWWGHMVGWASHHDQWLSEGFADFSAGLYLQYTNKTLDKYLKYYENSRNRLLEKNQFGRRANDAGPLWTGLRLSSEKNPGAYQTVVYGKGGYVLHMIRWMMYDAKEGDKPFIAMMHDFVAQHLNRNASTESFQKVVEKHMRPVMNVTNDGKMDWFFQQWVYGTVIPRYKLEQTVTANPDGSFQLKGSISQSEVPEDFKMVVPLYADFEGRPIRLGAVRITGAVTIPFDIQLPKKPKRVLLNANHDVLEQM